MKKYRNNIALLLIVLSVGMVSCKKSFLEVVPKGSLIAVTYNDYNKLMNGSQFYQSNYAPIWHHSLVMGDEVAAEENIFNSVSDASSKAFRWEDVIYQPTEPLFMTQILGNIYVLNKIIKEVPDATGGTQAQKLSLQAEANAVRAFTYFQLINFFGKPYVASTAANDPGFPIITESDITANNFTRASVQQVYDLIIKDLTAALPHLPQQPLVATRMSRAAAEGLLGKVYLFMGKYNDALGMFNTSFNDIAQMSAPARLYDYNVTFGANGSFLPVDQNSGPNSPFNNETDLKESVLAVMYNVPFNGNGLQLDYLTITPETVALYGASDWRLKFYSNLQADTGLPITIDPIQKRLRKYGVQFVRIGLELPELYLLRAEVKARLNDLTGAITDVEILRRNRMPQADAPVPLATSVNQTALVKFILDERIREFAGEGYRWFDMRRLYNDPLFSGQPAAVHRLYLTAGGVTQYTLRPERLTLRLPQFYIDKNPGMINNP